MKVVIKDFGIHLIPESEEEKLVTKRFWNYGINLFGESSNGTITLGFADLMNISVDNISGMFNEIIIKQKVSTKDALCALEVCKFNVIKSDMENTNPFSRRNLEKNN